MKILYGVVGEGMGHAMRSRVVLAHLVSQGHEVVTMASGRAVDFLAAHFADVNRIHGLHMITEENRVRRGKTVLANVIKGSAGIPRNIKAYFELIDDFSPQMVITDFESWTYTYAKAHGVPVVSIDNMQIINRCRHDPEIIAGCRTNFEIARAFVKGKLPFCDYYLVTTFFRPPIRKERTSLHAPILRPEIIAARPTEGDHLLVYQTAAGHERLVQALDRTGLECRIYGMRSDLREEQVEKRLRYRPFSEQGFIEDLASARAVIASGGFTLMGEAVYLHKPMLAIPLERQFEQTLNARYLERLGYGHWARSLEQAGAVQAFVEAIPACRRALDDYTQDDNRSLLDAVDQQIDRVAADVY